MINHTIVYHLVINPLQPTNTKSVVTTPSQTRESIKTTTFQKEEPIVTTTSQIWKPGKRTTLQTEEPVVATTSRTREPVKTTSTQPEEPVVTTTTQTWRPILIKFPESGEIWQDTGMILGIVFVVIAMLVLITLLLLVIRYYSQNQPKFTNPGIK